MVPSNKNSSISIADPQRFPRSSAMPTNNPNTQRKGGKEQGGEQKHHNGAG
jgi:hypothetical protein